MSYFAGKGIECCYQCDKRKVGCHSICEDYLKEKEEHEKELQLIQKEHEKALMLRKDKYRRNVQGKTYKEKGMVRKK